MAEFSFSSLPKLQARDFCSRQKSYSSAQVEMAKTSPILIWVRSQNKGVATKLRAKTWIAHGPDCAYCGILLTVNSFTVDHIIARAKGGKDTLDNLAIACRSCNSSKGAN
jgi:5-methylcytosine-specific restriction endonuclease McrA